LRAAWIKEFRRLRHKDVVCNVYVYLTDLEDRGSELSQVARPATASSLGGSSSVAAGSSAGSTSTASRPRHRPQKDQATRRTTVGRILTNTARIGQEPGLENTGPIVTAHLSRHLARLPPSETTGPIVIPSTNTFRQMQQLDEQGAMVRERQAQAVQDRAATFRTVPIRIAGITIEVEISLHHMRKALELPQDMNLDGVANFREAEINNPAVDANDD